MNINSNFNQITKHTEMLTDITNSCRLCLSNNSIVRNILNNNEKTWAQSDISSQILQATTIQVTHSDGAIGICRSCLQNIIAINNFQRKCRQVNAYLISKYQGLYFYAPINYSSTSLNKINFTGFIDLGNEFNYLKKIKDEDDLIKREDGYCAVNDNVVNLKDVFEIDIREQTKSLEKESIKSKNKIKTKRKSSKSDPNDKTKTNECTGGVDGNNRKRICHVCGKLVSCWRHHVKIHKTNQKICDICDKGFTTKRYLLIHMLVHMKPKLCCDTCGKEYRHKDRLKRHLKVHTGERPFPCDFCPKKFRTKDAARVHTRIHTGEKPHSCHFCRERFTHSYGLKHHLEKFHNKNI